ncbi:MAG: hypothetical protein J6S27_07075 [Thermoguttaceae bacterium]|nr:hypothetical protein [Thermoguttaceae bacterium]MBR2585686.1 hypothetical protein [Thermoguttaceae bacterium]
MTVFSFPRRRFIGGGLLALLTLAAPKLFAAEKLNYEYLQRNLYPKTADEEAYLRKVLEAVEKGTLPAKLVYMTIKSASRHGKAKRIYYFSTTLGILAKKNGIKSVPVLSQGGAPKSDGEDTPRN